MVTVDLMVTEATEATGMAMDITITDIMDIAMGNYYLMTNFKKKKLVAYYFNFLTSRGYGYGR